MAGTHRRQPLPLAAVELTTTLWGLLAFAVVLPAYLTHTPPGGRALTWLALGAAVMGASWWWAYRYFRDQVARGKTLDELRALSPAAFERWVGARFHEQGWAIEHTGTQGDHGIDLVLNRPGEKAVVQAKKWSDSRSVGEPVVRDLYGAMTAAGASRAYLVTTGRFSEAARAWADGKPVELWDADTVVRLSRSAAADPSASTKGTPPRPATAAIPCPDCGATLVERRNRRTGEAFLGCSRYPACRHTEALAAPTSRRTPHP